MWCFPVLIGHGPPPNCTRCRGKICTKDMTYDFCVGWSSSQWEAFAKKRSYKERKRSRPSGSLPPATKTSPHAGTSSEILHPEASSSSPSSLPSGGQAKKGESRDAPGAGSREASSPLARPRSSERGGSVSGRSSGERERSPVSSAPFGAGEGGAARSQRTPPVRAASSVASPRSSLHALQCGESGESSAVRSRSRSSHVCRSSDRETRKDRGARSRSGISRDQSLRSRSRSASRSRSSGRERRRRDSSRSLSSRVRSWRDQSRSSDRYWSRRVRSVSRRDRVRSSDRYHSRHDRSRSFGSLSITASVFAIPCSSGRLP